MSLVRRTYRYRIYPSRSQTTRLNETLRLCFGKNGNEWGLYIVSGVNAENWTPLRNSSRRLRVESTLWLTSLRDALVKASQTSTEEVNEATLRAVEAVKQIRGG